LQNQHDTIIKIIKERGHREIWRAIYGEEGTA
jgi:hypothetical protein